MIYEESEEKLIYALKLYVGLFYIKSVCTLAAKLYVEGKIMSLCPNYYDNENDVCLNCDYSEDCKADCEAYELKKGG